MAAVAMARGLDPLSRLPVYQQIADTLRAEIESGALGAGERVPSENELMAEFSSARQTVRQALSLLKAEGLIYAERGRGAFVRSQAPVRRLAFDRFARRHREEGKAAYFAEMEGRKPDVQVLFVGPDKANSEAAGWLGVRTGAKVLRRSRRYLAAGQPMELATSWVPWALAEGTAMTQENAGPGGIYARIEEQGRELARFTEEVHARMPTPDEARALSLPVGTPVFRLIRVAYDTNDKAVEACDTIMAADRYVLNYELPAR
jgi:GntR family transcriptional regulator